MKLSDAIPVAALGVVKVMRRVVSLIQGESCRSLMRLCGVAIGKGARIRGWCFFWRNPKADITLGEGVRLSGGVKENPVSGGNKLVLIAGKPGARLEIGDGSGISASVIYAYESIVIGKRVLIGGGCSIYDNDFHCLDRKLRSNGNTGVISAPVVIESDVWLGAQVMILKGVRVGKGSVIAARSVVTGDIPEGVIAAGVPARVVSRLE